jgi:hypothetical protein
LRMRSGADRTRDENTAEDPAKVAHHGSAVEYSVRGRLGASARVLAWTRQTQ